MHRTAEQILAYATTAIAAKAAAQQANITKWSLLGTGADTLWGICQSSSEERFRTQVDVLEPSFKCTCPSRKPCKHGLGLYLAYAHNAAAFTEAIPPQWVIDWLRSRQQQAEVKTAKLAAPKAQLSTEQQASKERGQKKRQTKRNASTTEGLSIVETWLGDTAREGLASLKTKPLKTWEEIAARMVDARASGLANRIRRIASQIQSTTAPDWELSIGRELALIALLVQAYANLDTLPAALQADVKAAIGWTTTQEDVLKEPGVFDIWLASGSDTHLEEKLSRRANYFLGRDTGKWALLLQYADGGHALPPPISLQTQYRGNLHYYPSATPLRAVLAPDIQLLTRAERVPFAIVAGSFESELHAYSHALAANPFLGQLPLRLAGAVPHAIGSALHLVSSSGEAIPVSPSFSRFWQLIALAGGAPIDVMGLWNGRELRPLSALVHGIPYNFDASTPR